MRASLELTARDLVRALAAAAVPSIDAVARTRAEGLAREREADGFATRVLRRGAGVYEVEARRATGAAQ